MAEEYLTDGSAPSHEVQYLNFIEGNPGVPGDGVLVSSTGGLWSYIYELAEPLSLSSANNGITLSIYPPTSDTMWIAQTQYVVPGYSRLECSIGLGAWYSSVNPPIINGVSGFTQIIAEYELDFMASTLSNNGNCGSVSAQDLALESIEIYRVSGSSGTEFLQSIDAAAIGFGINVFPTESTMSP